MEIAVSDLQEDDIARFLQEHLQDMHATSPPESIHALDLDALRHPNITFWTVRQDSVLIACGALKRLNDKHGEIKSMRTSRQHRGQGVASHLLRFILEQAKHKGLSRVSLETGSMAFFAPARKLYQNHGFVFCEPFADYSEDPNSVFMTRPL
ncbi:putative N-acetyltransferase YsnE [Thalassocella blandensis]|nr:putative N-acetyltransferase YsnE [Thalassocella blandensis]